MQPYLNDQYAPLAHIPELRGHEALPGKTWIDQTDRRRLAAYGVLGAYRTNTRRFHLPESVWQAGDDSDAGGKNVREYGDPSLLIDTARALLLGDEQTVTLDGGASEAFVDWLTGWADAERLTQKLLEGEEHSIGDGDGVYVLGWSPTKRRPRLRVFDPGFYFPDTENKARVAGWEDDEYPATVHLAWEWKDETGTTWIRRHTWQLRKTETPWTPPYGGTAEWVCLYRVVDYDTSDLLSDVDVYSPDLARKAGTRPITTPSEGLADGWANLGIDFIPVVHVPNDPSTTRTFGRSLLLRIAHILDDLANTDTDLAAASQAANPNMVYTGAGAPENTPVGGAIGLPENATAAFMDTSKNLAALTGHVDTLLDRLAVNARLAQALLGRVQPNDVPSGYALELGFAPAKNLLREMRTVRDEKYPLLLRFAMRLAQVGGVLPAGEVPRATIELGSALPADLPAAIAAVKDLLPVQAISTETAVKMLQTAGLPIEDTVAEVEAIRNESFEQAFNLVRATGDLNAARKMLGLPPVTVAAITAADAANTEDDA